MKTKQLTPKDRKAQLRLPFPTADLAQMDLEYAAMREREKILLQEHGYFKADGKPIDGEKALAIWHEVQQILKGVKQ